MVTNISADTPVRQPTVSVSTRLTTSDLAELDDWAKRRRLSVGTAIRTIVAAELEAERERNAR